MRMIYATPTLKTFRADAYRQLKAISYFLHQTKFSRNVSIGARPHVHRNNPLMTQNRPMYTKQRHTNIISNLYNNYKRQVYVSIGATAPNSTHAESNYREPTEISFAFEKNNRYKKSMTCFAQP